MDNNFQKPRDFIASGQFEAIKMYITYDVNGRMEFVYSCSKEVPDQGPCLVTQYVYDGVSSRVTKMKESIGTWLAAYEI